jgi:cysteine-rich repeat protein
MISPFSFFRRSNVRIFVFALCVIIGAGLFFAGPTLAQEANDALGVSAFDGASNLSGTDIRVIVARIINIFLGLLSIVAVGIVIYGGVTYMTAGGDEGKVEDAKKILVNGAIGLAIVLSAFAISRFVLTRLQDATGLAGGDPLASCADLALANDPRYDELCGRNVNPSLDCSTNPAWCCSRDNFIVQSITPRTDTTNMNNATIRVVFSRGIRTSANQAIQIWRDGVTTTNQFDFRFADPSSQVLEATYTGTSTCAGTTGCLPVGDYRVVVQNTVRDVRGQTLQESVSCGSFPREATFRVNTPNTLDTVNPVIPGGIAIDGVRASDRPLPVNREVEVSVPMTDNTGAGYIRLDIGREGQATSIVAVGGPTIARGSGAAVADPFTYTYRLFLASNTRVGERYVITARAFDIDGNSITASTTFVTVAAHCTNGIQDGDETDVDAGPSCQGVGQCSDNWQCVSGQCVSGQCQSSPIITSIDPWDGAAGSWVTVNGRFFGSAAGQIQFGVDRNNNGVIADVAGAPEWINATLAACSGASTWTDSAIIAEVPSDAFLPQGSFSAIRVVRADNVSLTDTTIDARGPRGGPRNGLFLKNTTNRPRLCRVEVGAGQTAGLPRTDARAIGQSLDGSVRELRFGLVTANVTTWADTRIDTRVPEGLRPGVVSVAAVVDGIQSNAVPFTVLSADTNDVPSITSVDPTETTPGSYVTLNGRGFSGSLGIVYLANSLDVVCAPPNLPAGCVEARATLPPLCGDTWTPTQVVFQVPTTIQPGRWFVNVRTATGLSSPMVNTAAVTVVAGAARPSICQISPDRGPAPRAVGQGLTINGANFTSTGTVYFWTAGANASDVTTWLSSRTPDVQFSSASQVLTPIPSINGVTMQTGPIRVSSRGQLSNSVTYTVLDCRTLSDAQIPAGQRCCTDGSLLPENQSCAGESRDAGYVWRFTNGQISQLPAVIEECVTSSPSNVMPSPTPSDIWGRTQSCINAEIRARFTTPMDASTLVTPNVRIVTCGDGTSANCTSRTDVTSNFLITYESQSLRVVPRNAGDTFTPNTWYRVELGTAVRSQEVRTVLGRSQTISQPLQPTRPCGAGTAYCFTFQTGTRRCEIASAHILPSEYTTNILGVLQDPRFPRSGSSDPLNPPNPLFYYIWGAPREACTVVNADGLGWTWSVPPVDAAFASVRVRPNPPQYTDSRADVAALSNSVPDTAEIRATATTPSSVTLQASSTLTVDLGDPRVIAFWPNCSESCTNANIGVQFNQRMLPNTYAGALRVYQCADSLCATRVGEVPTTVVEENNSLQYRVAPANPLLENTWYLVTVSSQIRAMSALGSTNPGNPLEAFSWRFRTKATAGICIAASVVVEPTTFTASSIGQVTGYMAIPVSPGDQCSPLGQELNPWTFGWRWSSADQNVATVSTFTSLGSPRSQCTPTCVPRGSSVSLAGIVGTPVCGNGRVDAGEDCDIALSTEEAGVSCSLFCLRPGNPTQGTGPNMCGNGAVDVARGEECDPTSATTSARFCNERCLLTGNPARGNSQNQCGNSAVEPLFGEECEPRVGAEADLTCTTECQRSGSTLLSASWCETRPVGTATSTFVACATRSASICGDGVVNLGEVCEIVTGSGTGAGTIRLAGVANPIAVQNVSVCTNRCLLNNICNEPNIPTTNPTLRCTPGTPGCTAACTLRGSDVSYSTPSLCGDGNIGTGEYGMCEYSPADLAARLPGTRTPVGQNPAQIVRAIGASVNVPDDGRQETTISAEVIATAAGALSTRVGGTGDFSLQCGFVEYPDNAQIGNQANNCPQNAGNGDNRYGVGINSCCQLRPERISTYPADGAGFQGTAGVCRNTLIEFVASGQLDETTLERNMVVARGYAAGAANVPCRNTGDDVTSVVRDTLAYQDIPRGIIRGTIFRVQHFFRALLQGQAFASALRLDQVNVAEWCGGATRFMSSLTYIEDANGVVENTRVRLQLLTALEPNTTYAVLLRGGRNGIRNTRGVSLRPDTTADTAEASSWVFETSRDICRVNEVSVEPSEYLFTAPNTTTEFIATSRTVSGEAVVPIPGIYNWSWSWGPQNNAVFAIPASGASVNTDRIIIGSRTLGQGETATGFAQLQITEDVLATAGASLPRFTDTFDLMALFCENPWPRRGIYPYEDGISRTRAVSGLLNNDAFDGDWTGGAIPPIQVGPDTFYPNIRFGYCADAGRTNDTTDDLPYLRPTILGAVGDQPIAPFGDSLRRVLFFNNRNDDAIGYQVFDNTTRAAGAPIVPPPPPPAALPPLNTRTPDGRAFRFINAASREGEFPINQPFALEWEGGQNPGRVRISILLLNPQENGYETGPNAQMPLTSFFENEGSVYVTIPDTILQPTPGSRYEILIVEESTNAQGFSARFRLSRPSAPVVPSANSAPVVTSYRSLTEWYQAKFGSVPQTMRSVTMQGYDALTDGNSYYISALNQFAEQNRNTLGNHVYLFTINADAEDSTKRVFGSLINSLRFNINISDVGLCSVGTGTLESDIYTPDVAGVACTVDSECRVLGEGRICANARTKLLRDWDRLQDIASIQTIASVVYARDQRFPVLSSGTYIPGYTNSRWPSWGATLSQALGGSLPIDPLNTWSGCDGTDPQTCWNPDTSAGGTFQCPVDASIYEYTVRADGSNYNLHVPFEYFRGETGIVDALLDTDRLTTDRFCVGSPQSPTAGACGNGIINAGEECDPPGTRGTSRTGASGQCANGQIATTTCSNTCQLEAGECRPVGRCGNGVIEGGERCDDGGANGEYGRCSLTCLEISTLACGNNTLDVTPTGAPLERCEKSRPEFQNGFCDKQSCKDARFDISGQAVGGLQGTLSGSRAASAQGDQLWVVTSIAANGANPNRAHIYLSGIGQAYRRVFDQASLTLNAVSFASQNVGLAAGGTSSGGNAQGVIVRTTNGGTNWNTITVLGASTIRSVHMVNEQLAFIVDSNGSIRRSEDGGQTWNLQQAVGNGVNSINRIQFIDAQVGWAVGSGGVFLTINGGQIWTQTVLPPSFTAYDAVFANQYVGYVSATQGARMARTSDGGQTWELVTTPSLSEGSIGASGNLLLLDAETIIRSSGATYAQNQVGYAIVASNNGGETWSQNSVSNVQNGGDGPISLVGTSVVITLRDGSTRLVLVPDNYCAAPTSCTEDRQCENTDLCIVDARPTYHPVEGSSCAFDCQDMGGYCGDGLVNETYEECDDANDVNSDSCTNLCFRRTVINPPTQVGTFCGDGIIQSPNSSGENERCDNGVNNGVIPSDPPYGQRIVYCSARCTEETRDPVAFCGNGIVEAAELCDTLPDGQVTTSRVPNGAPLTCAAGTLASANRGGFTCNNCRAIDTTCTVCGVIETCSAAENPNASGGAPVNFCRYQNGAGAMCQNNLCANTVTGEREVCPAGQRSDCRYVGTINPTLCTDGIDNDGDGLTDCADFTGGGANPRVSIVNPIVAQNASGANVWGRANSISLIRGGITDFRFGTNGLGIAQFLFQGGMGRRLISTPTASQFGLPPTSLFGLNDTFTNSININTNAQCADVYNLDINDQYIGSYTVVNSNFTQNSGPGSLFPYTVNGEAGMMSREFVLNPAVPQNVFRVVVRWSREENAAEADFLGNLFHNDFSEDNARMVSLMGARIRSFRETVNYVCDDISQQDLSVANGQTATYWWSTGCTPISSGDVANPAQVYVHPEINLTDTFVQSMTIDLRNANTAAPFQFFIDDSRRPMYEYLNNRGLTVELYEYHANQSPLRSVYTPRVFTIRGAAGTSSNPNASYWHVFNIVRNPATGNYEVRALGPSNNGTIETGIEDIHNNL